MDFEFCRCLLQFPDCLHPGPFSNFGLVGSTKEPEASTMQGEVSILIGFLIAVTWGRYLLGAAVREVRIRRRHYR